jgi:hypothetical protein
VNIDALCRLKKRLPEKHPMYEKVSLDLYNSSVELNGDEKIDEILRGIPFSEPFAIVKNFHINDPDFSNDQIDFLVAMNSYFLVLKVKNWTGTLDFKDSPRQVIQTTPTYTKSHDCPCVQAESIRVRMVHWLKKNNAVIPVYHAVIFPYASTIINKSSEIKHVHVASELPLILKEYAELPPALSEDLFEKTISNLWTENPLFSQSLCQIFHSTF